ncbi:hypothetical protein [Schlesneria paludicola]|uniref:hypothetical protein n=1 Tax=Schlesneria paludicola TaxID=360056 RepID=UPI00029A8A60|nr:hypothetical protein [Schlesneria paludicola]
MKVQQFLEHHGLNQNPFSQEDAQTDPLFQKLCADGTFHPAWDKIYGDPSHPSTAVVFGEKGSGKTALRLQIVDHTAKYNTEHPDDRVFIVDYDDFNPFLDSFNEKVGWAGARPEKTLSKWRLWDHIDCILSLATTHIVDDLLKDKSAGASGPFQVSTDRISNLTRVQKRDLLLLAAFYDRSTDIAQLHRWSSLRRKLGIPNWRSYCDFSIGMAVTLAIFGILAQQGTLSQFGGWWPWVVILAGWAPWLWHQSQLFMLAWKSSRQIRVLDRQVNQLRSILSNFDPKDLVGQPIPARDRSDDRYELLTKLQNILESLGFESITVLVDRVDEPHLINGSPERMKALIWSMFDNKFLKHAGIGFKLLLPIEISFYLTREDKEFYERSRLDKQNLIRTLEWTGESLFDLANDRARACAINPDPSISIKKWFDDAISEGELVGTLARLRVPRHLFKFLHRLLVEHCHRYTDESPRWVIDRETLQSSLAIYLRDLEAYDRGLGTG